MANINNFFNKETPVTNTNNHPKRITKWLHYTKLTKNRNQYCDATDPEEIEQLADLICADGEVLQDLLVRKVNTDEYEIIAGHKRAAACKLLVENRGMKKFEFLPCIEKNISDVKAEFEVYSSNQHHVETPFEIMHKLEKMQYLLNNYPDEFPDMQSGRMVDRLAKKFNMSKTTVGEYSQISKNLSEPAMQAFQEGELDKSAAVVLSSFDEEKQKELIDAGITSHKDLKEYKEHTQARDKVMKVKSAVKFANTYRVDGGNTIYLPDNEFVLFKKGEIGHIIIPFMEELGKEFFVKSFDTSRQEYGYIKADEIYDYRSLCILKGKEYIMIAFKEYVIR